MRLFDELEIEIEREDGRNYDVKVTEIEEEWDGDEFGTWTDVVFKKAYWESLIIGGEWQEFTDDDYDDFTDAIRDEIEAILRES